MGTFIIRVELKDAKYEAYELLHKNMDKEGFKKTIKGAKGDYFLPHAEYCFINESYNDEVAVRDKAINIILSVKCEYTILVTKSAGMAWQGLEKIK